MALRPGTLSNWLLFLEVVQNALIYTDEMVQKIK